MWCKWELAVIIVYSLNSDHGQEEACMTVGCHTSSDYLHVSARWSGVRSRLWSIIFIANKYCLLSQNKWNPCDLVLVQHSPLTMGCCNAQVSNDMLSNSIATSDMSDHLCYDVLLWLCLFFFPLCTVHWLMFPFTSTPKILPTDLITFPIFHSAHPLFMRSCAISWAWVV